MVESLQLLAERATGLSTSSDERLQNGGQTLRLLSILLLLNPLGGSSLELLRSILASLLEQQHDALLHLLVTEHHTHTELAEVLEQRVVEGRTLTLLVLGVGR